MFADIFLGVMIIRGENLALFGEARGDGPLVEMPVNVIFQRIGELESEVKGKSLLSVDLGFLDEI
jgi:hypothetical protein